MFHMESSDVELIGLNIQNCFHYIRVFKATELKILDIMIHLTCITFLYDVIDHN